jgi:imidazolonepropionase-like amidohydrolase
MMTSIRPNTILIGPNLEPASGAAVTMDRSRIIAVGDPPATAEAVVELQGTTLIPGFIDAHVHIALADPAAVVRRGVTTARDLAWSPDEIWPLVERSLDDAFNGPHLIAAGQMLTVARGYPTRAAWAPEGTGRVVSGPANAAQAVAEQANAGACVIKVALNAEAGPTPSADVMGAIVRAAHARGLKVTGHVTGLNELDKALDTGVDELAHILMSNEVIPEPTIDRMVDRGLVVVPTLSCRFGSDRDTAVDNLRRFLNAGGRVVYGTDLGNEGPKPGIDALEIAALSAAGMSGRRIIASATVDAARWLGLSDTGVIASGARADLVAVAGDPLSDPSALTDIVAVWRAGRRIV